MKQQALPAATIPVGLAGGEAGDSFTLAGRASSFPVFKY